ncbi:hypothetical protein [Metasolibacillus sp.]|uniref:hypothetical protein n=1 Tax=Metasolibacillus sp. TaxID=2703680 RepID=UPI0025E66085|nr:hypothetical protein [Metasolibacillus sp.]MCT6924426.1 DUF2269 domain-containing protein [Metasolibacillus sp.]MCT6940629.1 DUF2269 domain-containing protein [Metasolibacillus sp.]
MLLFNILLYVHIASAIVSIGPLFVLFSILKRMETADDAALVGYVHSFQASITTVKHGGHVLVLSGILLIWRGGWPWHTSWIVLTIALMIASIYFLAQAFKPTMKTFGTPAFNRRQFIAKLRRSTWLYVVLLLIMLWFMVAKPMLW